MYGDNETRYALLIDLDGVIYQSDREIAGAADTLEWLEKEQIPFLFVTNTTSCSRRTLLEKFDAMGIEAAQEKIVTPIVATTQWLNSQGLNKAALFVSQDAKVDFSDITPMSLTTQSRVDAVIIGDLGEAWNFQMLNSAFRLLMQEPSPEFIALGMTRYWRGVDGLRLDVAPFVKALEHACGYEARVFGKPAAAFFESALALLNADAEQTLMIGDDIAGDIDAAQRCGIRGLMVKTGKYRDADLTGSIKPHAVLESIADLPEWWASHL